MTHQALHDRLSDVEAYLTHEFEQQALDPTAYIDAIHALADAQLALARAGTPAAERPMREASEAEMRFQRREQRNARARTCLRAAVAASLCLADGVDAQAGEWLLRLSQSLPVMRLRSTGPQPHPPAPSPYPSPLGRPVGSGDGYGRGAERMHHLRSHRRIA